MVHNAINVELSKGGFARQEAVESMQASGLTKLLKAIARGPFGHTALTISGLDALVDATDLGICAAHQLEGVIVEELSGSDALSFALPELSPEHRQLLAAFQLVTTADAFIRRARELCPMPEIVGSLQLDRLIQLLTEPSEPIERFRRGLQLARAFVKLTRTDPDQPGEARAVQALAVFMNLLRQSVIKLALSGPVRPLLGVLESRSVQVAGFPYHGLEIQEIPQDSKGLLPVRAEQIVGNDKYVQAGLRLARDVAAYDFERRRNPKRLNQIIFGLGRPGCGKTITAHAVGNYFLEYCAERGVPAHFVVVRRTDWASSYQNASALNLVRLFKEEVYGFEGVCGVYWPDIDTAFASRAKDDLRIEEQQNLGAVFGIFDGTLLPRDGKWFLICDANTLHMDEATISRITQSPYTVDGPTRPDDYIRLMRDILLKDVHRFLPKEEESWRRIGEEAVRLQMSGRNVDSVCGNIRSYIQDFEFPDEYFNATPEERDRIIESLGRPVAVDRIMSFIEDWAEFQREAETRAEEERFEREVDTMVRHLNASRIAAERAAGLTGAQEA